jgi:DNA primase
VFLPPGDDPDSLVRRSGRAAVEALIEGAKALVDVYLDDLVGEDAGITGTARAAGKIAGLLAGVEDGFIREKLLRGVAGRLGVSEAALLEASAKQTGPAPGASRSTLQAAPVGARSTADGIRGRSPSGGIVKRPTTVHFSAEAELVELVLCDADIARRAEREQVFQEFVDPEWRRLGEAVLERRAMDAFFDPAEFLQELPRAMGERVVRRLSGDLEQEEIRRAGVEWFAQRDARRSKAARSALIARLRAAEHRGDQFQVAAALAELKLIGKGVGPDERPPAEEEEISPGE